ncbi:MAG TPA: PA14 domain-containing protein [Candidatus Hydrogenedentes bacterium]|nr:PA14 domain-containing protein [Candidatus Hydrogenedentota bacterium]HRT21743.1 PA14 domain-containing protein [Candidatus Hydrogenedentota bacterium]HRT65532.1 PA14 domain-containing protein [Candidatus Hydrogenedentota bacterium]
MAKPVKTGVVLTLAILLLAAPGALAAAISINFDTVLQNVWYNSGVWPLVISLGVISPEFTLDPSVCDVNGGFDISQTPVIFYPNHILDADEMAVVSAILANPNFDQRATGGTCHADIVAAWNRNYAQAYHDLGGGVGGPERLLGPYSMIPNVDLLFTVIMTIGDNDSQSFPVMLMNAVVDDETAQQIVRDPNLHVPNPDNYTSMRQYVAWCGDADGDGVSNLHEYQYYYPLGQRTAYLNAVLDPNVKPPGSTRERLCDGTGGFLGEYFDEQGFSNLKMLRLDQQVAFDWGEGSPSPVIEPNTFSVCWTGWVKPDYTEDYTFLVRTDDGVRLWLNGELIIDQWNDHGSTTYTSAPKPLVAGNEYLVRMDFYENGGKAVAWLGWQSDHQEKKAIQEMQARPGVGIGDRGKDWIRNPANGHFYRITDPMTWPEYRAQAIAWDGYPVTIDNAEENEWIHKIFGTFRSDFWIGANDSAVEGAWIWDQESVNFFNGDYTNGAVVPPWYANWNDQEPNNVGNEDCGVFYYSSGKWNDLACTATRRGLVETETGRITCEGPIASAGKLWEGLPFELRVDVRHPTGNVAYQWKHNGENVPGATQAVLRLYPLNPEHDGAYSCLVTDESPASAETETLELTVLPKSELPVLGGVGAGVLAGICTLLGGMRLLRRRPSK